MPALLQVNKLHKAHGATVILEEATASFSTEQKIGIIGRNGAGKSTLCRIITGQEEADSGEVIMGNELRLAYLEQHDSFKTGENVEDFLMRRSGREHWECGAMAARFQIPHEFLDRAVASLAGGFQTRVKLAAMLLTEPNFLIMDEPSNYLDLSTLILLENFLIGFKGGYLIVSHDREFLKRTCDNTLEVENGALAMYPGNIEEYFEFKEEQRANVEAYNRGVDKKLDQLQDFVDRFRAKASTAARAQSKMKQMEKLEKIEVKHSQSSVNIIIPTVEARSGLALTCDSLGIGYPQKDVASGISFDISRGERVAVLGNNGEGKSTFLKTIASDLKPKEGSFRWAGNLKIAYYAQHVYSAMDPEDNVYAHLARQCLPGIAMQDILNMAGCFLFKGDDVKKKIRVLSGGERARLNLAGLLLSQSHILLLDEPTNHLDFETVEALGRALRDFAGTVFFISHDRTFVNMVATNIVEVKDGKVRLYPGTYEDYVYSMEMAAQGDGPAKADKKAAAKAKAENSGAQNKSGGADDKNQKTAARAELAALQKELTKEEIHVRNLTDEQDKILAEMRDKPFYYSRERDNKLKSVQKSLEQGEKNRCQLQAKIDKLKN